MPICALAPNINAAATPRARRCRPSRSPGSSPHRPPRSNANNPTCPRSAAAVPKEPRWLPASGALRDDGTAPPLRRHGLPRQSKWLQTTRRPLFQPGDELRRVSPMIEKRSRSPRAWLRIARAEIRLPCIARLVAPLVPTREIPARVLGSLRARAADRIQLFSMNAPLLLSDVLRPVEDFILLRTRTPQAPGACVATAADSAGVARPPSANRIGTRKPALAESINTFADKLGHSSIRFVLATSQCIIRLLPVPYRRRPCRCPAESNRQYFQAANGDDRSGRGASPKTRS